MSSRRKHSSKKYRPELIRFVSPSIHQTADTQIQTPKNIHQSTGKDIKQFYQDLCSEEFPKPILQQVQTKTNNNKQPQALPSTDNCSVVVTSDAKAVNQLLKCAQQGDVLGVTQRLDGGVSIDAQDSYGWTALMCAVQAGHISVVKQLIHRGSDVFVLNKQSLTAVDLAEINGRADMVILLGRLQSDSISNKHIKSVESRRVKSPFFCNVCCTNVASCTQHRHKSSTLHIFNSKRHQCSSINVSQYEVPETNRGYQMMLRGGWSQDLGLGPMGKGKKYPVKTVLKLDRAGLGTGPIKKPKVTHFKANDDAAVNRSKGEGVVQKEKLKTRKDEGRTWEWHMRLYMNNDDESNYFKL